MRDDLNVYFYALYMPAEHKPCCGMVAASCMSAAKESVLRNFADPRYVVVRRVPEMVGIVRPETSTVDIVLREREGRHEQK